MMPTSPTALEDLNVIALWALFVAFEKRLASELVVFGVTVPGFRLIGELMQEPDGLRQAELASRLGVRPPAVAVAVARLEENRMVYRVQDPADPRARRVCLSKDASLLPGLDVLAGLESVLFDDMTEEERTQTRALLNGLLKRLMSQ